MEAICTQIDANDLNGAFLALLLDFLSCPLAREGASISQQKRHRHGVAIVCYALKWCRISADETSRSCTLCSLDFAERGQIRLAEARQIHLP